MSDAYDDDTPEQASPLWGEIDFNGKDIGIPAVPFDKIAVSGRGELLMVSLFTDTVRVKAILRHSVWWSEGHLSCRRCENRASRHRGVATPHPRPARADGRRVHGLHPQAGLWHGPRRVSHTPAGFPETCH